MAKRFKGKHRKKYNVLKILMLIILIYISFNLIYNLIYNLYLSKLNNDEIIAHIIENSKNGKNSKGILNKYQNPQIILGEAFTFKEEESDVPVGNTNASSHKIYVYTTHENEAYSDKYLEVYNINPTVKMMGYILRDYLNDLGVDVIVEDKSVTDVLKKNGWSYKYSYDASKELIMPVISENKDLELIIDLHRDSAALSKTLLEKDNEKYARILFVVGAEYEGYEVNYELAKKMNELLENEVSGITRGISLKEGAGVNGIYNQNISNHSVLIELGGQYNEIEELNNTLKVLAKVILKYLER